MTHYRISVTNNSKNTATAIVYTQDPDASPSQYSLVWLSSILHPSSTAYFEWEDNYGFTLGTAVSDADFILPGEIYASTQNVKAKLPKENAVTVEWQQGSLQLDYLREGPVKDNFLMVNSDDAPAIKYFQGLTLIDKTTFLIQT